MVICQDIQLTPINGRTVRMTGDLTKCTTTLENGEITTLSCKYQDCDYTVSVGQTIRVGRKYPLKVNHIKAGKVAGKIVCYDLMVAPLNDSSIFIAPMLGSSKDMFLWDSLFVNAFIAGEGHTDCILLLYRWSSEPIFVKFESALCSFRNFRKKIDPDSHHVVFVFDVPKKYRESYDAYTLGKYSEMQDDYKLRVLDYHDFDIDGHTGQILFKSRTLRDKLESDLQVKLPKDAELHSKPSLEKETYYSEIYTPAKKAL